MLRALRDLTDLPLPLPDVVLDAGATRPRRLGLRRPLFLLGPTLSRRGRGRVCVVDIRLDIGLHPRLPPVPRRDRRMERLMTVRPRAQHPFDQPPHLGHLVRDLFQPAPEDVDLVAPRAHIVADGVDVVEQLARRVLEVLERVERVGVRVDQRRQSRDLALQRPDGCGEGQPRPMEGQIRGRTLVVVLDGFRGQDVLAMLQLTLEPLDLVLAVLVLSLETVQPSLELVQCAGQRRV